MRISIVVPTYNRPLQLSEVLKCILESDTKGFECIEIIVVDDGSASPAAEIVESFVPPSPFLLSHVYQKNAGPAEARNRGFWLAKFDIVLFIDDDILVFPDLIRKHAEAHISHPGSVIFGQCPYPPMAKPTPAFKYLSELLEESSRSVGTCDSGQTVRVEIVASGNLSVEKKLFKERSVYCSGLTIPVGEEFELSAYLTKHSIPVFFNPVIKGWHLQPATIQDSCIQNYKYGLGIAELVAKRPDVANLPQLKRILEVNGRASAHDELVTLIRKTLKKAMSSRPGRRFLLLAITVFESLGLPEMILYRAYRVTIGLFFAAGISEGRKRFMETT